MVGHRRGGVWLPSRQQLLTVYSSYESPSILSHVF